MKRSVIFFFVLYLIGIGSFSLVDRDEGGYFQAVHEMNARGEWALPTLKGETYADKPIFMYWVGRVVSVLFGEHLVLFRVAVIVFSLGTVGLAAAIEKKLFGRHHLSAWVLATSILFAFLSRVFIPDAFFVFFSTLGLFFFVRGWKEGKRWFVPFCAAIGFSVLAKGPLGAAMPVAIILVFALTLGREGRAAVVPSRTETALGIFAFLLVCLPWYLTVYLRTDGAFLYHFLIVHHWHRFSHVMEGHGGTPFRYVFYFCLGFFPWSLWLFSSRKNFFKGMWQSAECRFLLLWTAVWLVVLCAARTKLPGYLLPVFPAVAILTSRRMLVAEVPWTWWLARTAAVVFFVGLAVFSATGGWGGNFRPVEAVTPLFVGCAILCAVGGVLPFFLSATRDRLAVGEAVLAVLLLPIAFPLRFEPHRVPVRMGAQLKELGNSERVACYKFCPSSLDHYSGKDIQVLKAEKEVTALIEREGHLLLIGYEPIVLPPGTRMEVVGRYPELPLKEDVVLVAIDKESDRRSSIRE